MPPGSPNLARLAAGRRTSAPSISRERRRSFDAQYYEPPTPKSPTLPPVGEHDDALPPSVLTCTSGRDEDGFATIVCSAGTFGQPHGDDDASRMTYDSFDSIDDAESIRRSRDLSFDARFCPQGGSFEHDLTNAYERYRNVRETVQAIALNTQQQTPSTYDEVTSPAGELGDLLHSSKRPAGKATKLDVFLRLRGLEKHADALYHMGARTVNDLAFLEDDDFDVLGLDKMDVAVRVQ